jgi:hypothetical protein
MNEELNALLKELISRAKDQVGVDDFLFRTEFLACAPKLIELAKGDE